jgi:pyrophosphatase PpaX
MQGIKAVLFDVDGTLLDTQEFIFQAFEHTFKAHGLPSVPRSKLTLLVGQILHECYEDLTGYTGDDLQSLMDTHTEFQKKHFGLSVPYPGVLDTLQELQARGLTMAGVTNRHSRTAFKTLESAGVASFLTEIVCFDHVERPKPDAMHPLKALELIGEKPEHAVMVGDSHIDVEAGINAGTKTVFAHYGFHASLPPGIVPDAEIGDIRELLSILIHK